MATYLLSFNCFFLSFFRLGFKVACQNGLQVLENKHHLHENTDSFLEYFSEVFFLLSKQLSSCIKIYHQYLIDNALRLLCLFVPGRNCTIFAEKTIPCQYRLYLHTPSLSLLHFIRKSENFCAVLCKYTHYCTKLIF